MNEKHMIDIYDFLFSLREWAITEQDLEFCDKVEFAVGQYLAKRARDGK